MCKLIRVRQTCANTFSMDFTDIYQAKAAAFSPDGRRVLAISDDRVILRQVDTFQITHTWQIGPSTKSHSKGGASSSTSGASSRSTAKSEIVQCAWSCDSRYVLASRGALIQVFDVLDKDWNASIQIGVEGLTRAIWAPDGRNILCFSEWGVGERVYLLKR